MDDYHVITRRCVDLKFSKLNWKLLPAGATWTRSNGQLPHTLNKDRETKEKQPSVCLSLCLYPSIYLFIYFFFFLETFFFLFIHKYRDRYIVSISNADGHGQWTTGRWWIPVRKWCIKGRNRCMCNHGWIHHGRHYCQQHPSPRQRSPAITTRNHRIIRP